MNRTRRVATIGLLSGLLAFLGLGLAFGRAGGGRSSDAEARAVAQRFFASVNAKDFATTCDLLSPRYYRGPRVRDPERCAYILTLLMAWNGPVRFRIVDVRADERQAVVRALADGAPGRVVLARENGVFRIVGVEGR